jgi:hypothetical protein
MKPYTEALLPTPRAIVNRRASESAGARANALVEARIARRLRKRITQLGLQVRRHKEQAYSLVDQSLASMTRPISPPMCPYADRSTRATSIFERLVQTRAPALYWIGGLGCETASVRKTADFHLHCPFPGRHCPPANISPAPLTGPPLSYEQLTIASSIVSPPQLHSPTAFRLAILLQFQ